jgi:hypothetical protein
MKFLGDSMKDMMLIKQRVKTNKLLEKTLIDPKKYLQLKL